MSRGGGRYDGVVLGGGARLRAGHPAAKNRDSRSRAQYPRARSLRARFRRIARLPVNCGRSAATTT